jgi:asparagine synthase (glutamine-hydrolysing)
LPSPPISFLPRAYHAARQVVVHGFREWGLDIASKLDGDFAFVIVDEKTGELYAARDHMGVNCLYFGYGHDESLWFSSEMKAIVKHCERVMVFPPGHYYSSRTRQLHKYYAPAWQDPANAKQPLDLPKVRKTFEAAVSKRLMAEVPYGVLLSGGLDSSIVASLVAKQYGDEPHRLKTFSVGLDGSPDLIAAQRVADFLGTDHYSFTFTVQEGIDAISDVIYHLETYDVTTIRAGTPMFLLARKIKGLGIKMVLSGEGSDEALAGYLYFHKAPSSLALHEECVRKLGMLHLYDCLRANKATMAWGLEVRVPFLDKEFLDVVMSTDPEHKLILGKGAEKQHIEKWLMCGALRHRERETARPAPRPRDTGYRND